MPAAVLGELAVVLDRPADPGDRFRIGGAVVEIVGGAGTRDRLEVPANTSDPGGRRSASAICLLAVGWATVDLVDAAAALPPAPGRMSRDDLLGARARLASVAGTTILPPGNPGSTTDRTRFPIVLLEPATEGRLAAALARHGEGPVALYLGASRASFHESLRRIGGRGIRARPGAGPFGRQLLVGSGRREGPFVLLAERPECDGRRSSGDGAPGGDWATIDG